MMIRDERGGGDPKNVQFASCGFDPSLAGKTLADLTRAARHGADDRERRRGRDVDRRAGRLPGHLPRDERATTSCASCSHPATMIASDGEVPIFGRANPHPRSYGTFARVLGVYVREKKVLTLEDAVRKMSSFPAARLGCTIAACCARA